MDIPIHIFRAYDIRGVYGRDITDEGAWAIGWGFAKLVAERCGKGDPLISVGMDARLHSPALRRALVAGIRRGGARPLLLGLCPSPLTYYSAFELPGVQAYIMVTGSHNPPDENGFKPGIGTTALTTEDIGILGRLAAAAPAPDGPFVLDGDHYDITSHYIDRITAQFRGLKSRARRPDGKAIKVVIDAGNGTAGTVLPPIMRGAGFEVVDLFSVPDGNFPNHHPDPTLPETLETLREEVAAHRADLGMAFDGDADRVGVIDEKGEVVWGDMLLLMLARDVIRSGNWEEPPVIISEVKASGLFYREVTRAGGRPIMWKTGHSLIKEKMKETGAVLAGEMSGHLFFADRYYGYDDAVYAAMRIMETYAGAVARGEIERFSDLFADLPPVTATPEIRLPCSEDRKFALVADLDRKLREHRDRGDRPLIRDIVDVDGIRVAFEKGWGLVRASNTQPVLVMRFEAESDRDLEQYRNLFESIIDGLGSGS